jgi:hypothetical protein
VFNQNQATPDATTEDAPFLLMSTGNNVKDQSCEFHKK